MLECPVPVEPVVVSSFCTRIAPSSCAAIELHSIVHVRGRGWPASGLVPMRMHARMAWGTQA